MHSVRDFDSGGVVVAQLRVMTFNIRHGRGLDQVIDLPRVADVIARSGADLVALNEVDRCTRRSGGVDQARELARRLRMEAVFGSSMAYQGGEYGNALLSRWPVRLIRVYPLPVYSWESRSLLHAQVKWEGVTVHVLVTHLGLYAEERLMQLAAVSEVVEELEGPTILMGDFNAEALRMPARRRRGARVRDVWHMQLQTGMTGPDAHGYTFPADRPTRRIDYIFISSEWRIAKPFVTLATEASDHRPLVGTLAWAA